MIKKIIIIILLIFGIGLLAYPFAGNVYNYIRQMMAINSYNQQISQLDEQRKNDIMKYAEEYNKSLAEGNQLSGLQDPFNEDKMKKRAFTAGAYSGLNMEDKVIGYIKIPSINVDLPIYDNTSEIALRKGVGHLSNSSLPIGGLDTHCVLTGHTALAAATLLSDLDKLNLDDLFYIKVLDELHTYKVDQIKVVLPTDTSDLRIERGKDYISLITCTPYGINTHRLIVRGTRDDEAGSQEILLQNDDFWEMILRNSYLIVTIIIAILIIIITLIIIIVRKRRKNVKND